jgi:hypothetical protein
MYLFDDYDDYNFRWEGLVCSILNCEKDEDPDGYACQEFFDNFTPTVNKDGRKAINFIIAKLIKDSKNKNKDLITIQKNAAKATTQEEIINIIDQLYPIAKSLGYK